MRTGGSHASKSAEIRPQTLSPNSSWPKNCRHGSWTMPSVGFGNRLHLRQARAVSEPIIAEDFRIGKSLIHPFFRPRRPGIWLTSFHGLRFRVVSAVKGGMLRRQAAAHFRVGVSSAIRWVAQAETTGDLRPKPMGGDRRSTAIEAQADRSCRFWPKSRIRCWPSFRKRWRQRDIASACRRSGAFSIGASSRLKKDRARGRAAAPRHSEMARGLVLQPTRSRSD